MATVESVKKCWNCKNTEPKKSTCPYCEGNGYTEEMPLIINVDVVMNAIANVQDKADDIKEKVDEIKEVVDEIKTIVE